MPRKCYLYRIGGDEFMVLCINQKNSLCSQEDKGLAVK